MSRLANGLKQSQAKVGIVTKANRSVHGEVPDNAEKTGGPPQKSVFFPTAGKKLNGS